MFQMTVHPGDTDLGGHYETETKRKVAFWENID